MSSAALGPMSGPRGPDGPIGTVGPTTAYTAFTQPATGDSVVVPVGATTGLLNTNVFAQPTAGGGGGYYQVSAIGAGPTTATLVALADGPVEGATVNAGDLYLAGPAGPAAGGGGGAAVISGQWPGDANVVGAVAATEWHFFLSGFTVKDATPTAAIVGFNAAIGASGNTAVLILDEYALGTPSTKVQQVAHLDLSGGFAEDGAGEMTLEGGLVPFGESNVLRLRKAKTGTGILVPSFVVMVE